MGLTKTKLVPGKSMDEIDAASYGAGPSPLRTKAVPVRLRATTSVQRTPSTAVSLTLDGNWEMVQGGGWRERVSGDWEGSIPVSVPSSVHAGLVEAGRLPDPTVGRNQELAERESYKTWWLRTSFTRHGLEGPVRLVFDGICDRCTIWMNGRKLGSHQGMFAPIIFDIGELLEDQNTLVVRLHAIPEQSRKVQDVSAPHNVSWRDTVVFNNVYGWHYSRCPSLGIWRSVRLEQDPTVRIVGPYVTARDTTGDADLIVDLEGEGSWGGKLSGRIEPVNFPGSTHSFSASISGRGRKCWHGKFQIPDPQLWWPNGMGKQNLYRMTLTFSPQAAAQSATSATFTFGLRTVQMAPLPEGKRPDRYNWTYVINGRASFVKGSGWCTLDPLMDFRRERYQRFLSIARDQHCQMLRAWGCGMPETEDFYDLCDEYGIMVFQEWPTGFNSHLTQPYDLLEETVVYNTQRLRHRASLVTYCSGNESTKPFGRVIDMMGRLSIELDGTRPFHRGEPHGGSDHAYQCYWGREHLDEALRMESIFFGEFGIASMPVSESVRRYLPETEQKTWPQIKPDGGFAYHTPVFNKRDCISRLNQHAQYFVTPDAGLEQYCVASQVAQAIGVRHPLERARTNWPHSTGALYYKINDNFPAASWSTADWYGAAKICHYWVQDAFAPVHVCVLFNRLNYQGSKLTARAFLLDDNGDLDGKSWKVSIRAYDGQLRPIESKLQRLMPWDPEVKRAAAAGGPGTVRPLGHFEVDYGPADTTPLFVVAEARVGARVLDRTFYVLNFEAEKGCLFNRPRTTLALAVKGRTATVTNSGKRPAIAVEVARPGHLDTFLASDNYFWLEAGESTRVRVSTGEGLTVGAWNARTRRATAG